MRLVASFDGDPYSDEAKAIAKKLLTELVGRPREVIVLVAVHVAVSITLEMFEDIEERMAYARAFGEAMAETMLLPDNIMSMN